MLKVFAIYDSKAEAFVHDFKAETKGLAVRQFAKGANEEKSDFHRYAQDYTLFEIGTWDDREGVYAMHDAKISMGTALEYITPITNVNQGPKSLMPDGNLREVK